MTRLLAVLAFVLGVLVGYATPRPTPVAPLSAGLDTRTAAPAWTEPPTALREEVSTFVTPEPSPFPLPAAAPWQPEPAYRGPTVPGLIEGGA
jgi:hypothetical protein